MAHARQHEKERVEGEVRAIFAEADPLHGRTIRDGVLTVALKKYGKGKTKKQCKHFVRIFRSMATKYMARDVTVWKLNDA